MGGTLPMKIAFVIGEGKSRGKVDIPPLSEYGALYGCNLLIDEVHVDNTIACDRMALVSLLSREYWDNTNIWTSECMSHEVECVNTNVLPVLDTNHSDIHAVNLAATQESDIVIMIGFDITQTEHDKIESLKFIFTKFPNTSFVQIQAKSWIEPTQWNDIDNYSRDTIAGFKEWIKTLDALD